VSSVNLGNRRRLDTEKAGLDFHRLIKRNIVAVHQNGSAGVVMKLLEAARVVNMSVGADDGFNRKLVTAQQFHDAMDFVARVKDDGLVRDGIADDRAVALQQADGNREVQKRPAIARGIGGSIFCTESIRHAASIALGFRWSVTRPW